MHMCVLDHAASEADLFSKMGRFVQTHRTPAAYGHAQADCGSTIPQVVSFIILSGEQEQVLVAAISTFRAMSGTNYTL